jgi:hypothetical protein
VSLTLEKSTVKLLLHLCKELDKVHELDRKFIEGLRFLSFEKLVFIVLEHRLDNVQKLVYVVLHRADLG